MIRWFKFAMRVNVRGAGWAGSSPFETGSGCSLMSASRMGVWGQFRLCWLAILMLLATGCQPPAGNNAGSSQGPAEPRREKYSGQGPIQVTVTTGMVADLVRSVGGDRVIVRQLLGSGVDPHLYKVSREDVSQIIGSDLVVYSGLMLEGKMDETLRKLSATQPVWAVTEGLASDQLLQGGEPGGHADPHVWMDVRLWTGCLRQFAVRLAEFDPPNRELYQANAERASEEWMQVHAEGSRLISSISASSRVLVTSHDAFGYFGRAYGIEVRGVQGISTESEAGLQQINQLVDLLVERKLPAVFVESSVPRKSIEAIVAGAGSRGQSVQIAGPLFTDAMGEEGTAEATYPGMMRHNFRMITRFLGGAVQ